MSDDSTAVGIMNVARALSQQMQPTEEERRIQAGISATMAEVIKHDARHNVHDRPSILPSDAKPMGSVGSTNGWRDAAPLAPPPGQDLIERLVDTALPHGPLSGLKPKPNRVTMLRPEKGGHKQILFGAIFVSAVMWGQVAETYGALIVSGYSLRNLSLGSWMTVEDVVVRDPSVILDPHRAAEDVWQITNQTLSSCKPICWLGPSVKGLSSSSFQLIVFQRSSSPV